MPSASPRQATNTRSRTRTSSAAASLATGTTKAVAELRASTQGSMFPL